MNALEQFAQLSGHHWINGQLQVGANNARYDVLDPATEQCIGQLSEASREEVDRAVAVANQAQKRWNRVNGLHRAEAMHEVAGKIRTLRPLYAEMLTREIGKTYKESFDEVSWSATAVDYYAELGRHEIGRVAGPVVDGQFNFSLKEPLGVVVLILPFNYPLCLLCWQAAAALVAGNAVIIKPSELTSLTTLQFVQAFAELGEGLVQVLTGGADVGQQLVRHADTHMVAFTGGIETGRSIARECAGQYKRTLIETSGNDPFIVMPSAPIDIAARGAAFGAFLNCGQVCASSERFYVHEAVYDAFVERLVHHTRLIRVGNGLDKVDMGPLASRAQRERYERILQRAIEQGARVGAGGGRPRGLDKGWFAEATVLTGVAPGMEIMQDESFGPVAPICKVANLDEALALSNDSRYGLGSTIYTTNLEESMRASHELEAGMVWVNAPLLDNDAGPFGGRKQSGMGRQLGAEGLDNFRHSKFVMMDPAASPQDFWWFPFRDEDAFPGQR
ncbi:aldehyde dehydrogenase family protein [Pseudomonas akapageensis]|uniref:aldehyde dehydrogenase family protein n=1 Tax=Pseudomonas akapageensis TaxID=2609961 RepID=UPI001408E2F3|nr:aldehyde dehydrogenase family protein [Pseudomonas akapageensis]